MGSPKKPIEPWPHADFKQLEIALAQREFGKLVCIWLLGCTHGPTDPRECGDCTDAFLAAVIDKATAIGYK